MDIKILEEAASGKVREQTHEEAEKFMARIRSNLFDLLCHSDKARAELHLDLSEYGGKEAVERAIGKAVVNLFALGAVFGVKTCDVILKELGFVSEVEILADIAEYAPDDNGASPHTSEIAEAGQENDKAGSIDEQPEPASAVEVNDETDNGAIWYRQKLGKAASVEERTVIWKKIQVDRRLDSKARAELYQHMASLNKQEAA